MSGRSEGLYYIGVKNAIQPDTTETGWRHRVSGCSRTNALRRFSPEQPLAKVASYRGFTSQGSEERDQLIPFGWLQVQAEFVPLNGVSL